MEVVKDTGEHLSHLNNVSVFTAEKVFLAMLWRSFFQSIMNKINVIAMRFIHTGNAYHLVSINGIWNSPVTCVSCLRFPYDVQAVEFQVNFK